MLFDTIKRKQYLVCDNLLSSTEQNTIKNTLFDVYFPWFLIEHRDNKDNFTSTNLKSKNKNVKEYVKLVHSFYKLGETNASPHKNVVNLILQKILRKFNLTQINLIRAKANLQTSSSSVKKNNHSTPHTDTNDKHLVIIYYVNNSDGDTVIFNNKKVFKKISPKMGRILIFDGSLKHAAGYPIKSQIRSVININVK